MYSQGFIDSVILDTRTFKYILPQKLAYLITYFSTIRYQLLSTPIMHITWSNSFISIVLLQKHKRAFFYFLCHCNLFQIITWISFEHWLDSLILDRNKEIKVSVCKSLFRSIAAQRFTKKLSGIWLYPSTARTRLASIHHSRLRGHDDYVSLQQ